MDHIKTEIHDMSEKIYELQEKTEHLTNGQRYAAINEIERSITPLRKDLHILERELHNQKNDDIRINAQIDKILDQISELEDIKSDLTKRINTEAEGTRKEFNDKIISFMKEELSPIRDSLQSNQQDIQKLEKSVTELKIEMIQKEKNREIEESKKFDKFKIIVTIAIATVTSLSSLSLWLEPTVQTIIRILFGA